jgi:hypothetical protein
MVHAGRIEEVQNYCLCDVVQTAAVFYRVQLLRGELIRDDYLQAIGQLLDLIKSDPRLAPVAASMNESRLLLAEGSPGPDGEP